MNIEAAQRLLASMETDVQDVERWADLLVALSSLPDPINPELVGVIGYALRRSGDDVQTAWAKAFGHLGGTP